MKKETVNHHDEHAKIEHTVFNFCKHQKGWFKRILSPYFLSNTTIHASKTKSWQKNTVAKSTPNYHSLWVVVFFSSKIEIKR